MKGQAKSQGTGTHLKMCVPSVPLIVSLVSLFCPSFVPSLSLFCHKETEAMETSQPRFEHLYRENLRLPVMQEISQRW